MSHVDAKESGRPHHGTVRRGLSWVVGALAIVIGLEVLVSGVTPAASDRNNFFEYRYGHDEAPERVLVNDKLTLLAGKDPTILQVGDSSGFHGVMPPVVEGLIPGARYLNMSVFANLGYRGHYEMARAVLSRSKSTKVLVLYVTPVGFQPNAAMVSAKDLLGEDIWREYVSPLHRLFHLPSLALRRDITSVAYHGETLSQQARDTQALRRYPEAKTLLPATGGWTREHDNPDDLPKGMIATLRTAVALPASMPDDQVLALATASYGTSPMVFDWARMRRVNLAEKVFDGFRDLAESHGARLVIAAAPVPELFREGVTGQKLAEFQRTLETYHTAHPSVGVIPMVFLPDRYFSSAMHVSTPYTRLNSVRYAEALTKALAQIGVFPLAPADAPQRPTVKDVPADAIDGYGISPPVSTGDASYRTLREGRSEALIFAHVEPHARLVHLDFAEGTPAALLDTVGVSIFGKAAERLGSAPTAGSARRVTWRLPETASLYNGWLELLLSTRGAREWPAQVLSPDASGSALRIAGLHFTAD